MFSLDEKIFSANIQQSQKIQTLIIGRLMTIFLLLVAAWIWHSGRLKFSFENFPQGLFNLGEAQFAIGDKKGAEKTMKKLRKLDPNLANRLDSVVKGKIKNEIDKRNPLKKIPRLPF